MLKAALIASVVVAGAGATAFFLASHATSKEEPPAAAAGLPRLEEMHAQARVERFPAMDIKDLF
jgi:hypothetical protein